jgi:hypothetical protein
MRFTYQSWMGPGVRAPRLEFVEQLLATVTPPPFIECHAGTHGLVGGRLIADTPKRIKVILTDKRLYHKPA